MILKMLPTEMILAFEVRMNQTVMTGSCLEFASRSLICTLTLRAPISVVYIFKVLFGFFKNWATSCSFGKLGMIGMILALELATNQNVIKRPCLAFLSRILICTLTLRQQITQIYVFQLLFCFFKY